MTNNIYQEDPDDWETSQESPDFKGHISNGWKAEFLFYGDGWIDYIQHRPKLAFLWTVFMLVSMIAVALFIYAIATIPFGTLPPCPAINMC